MRALTPSCGSSYCFFDQDRDRKEETSSQGTDPATPEGAAEPAARRTGVLSASYQLTGGADILAGIPGTEEACTASSLLFLARRERRTGVLKFLPTA